MPVRVLLADDNALYREGLARLLGTCADATIVGQAGDAREVVRKATLLRPDVVVMDLAMPGGGGVVATHAVLAERPELAVCILTVSEQEEDLFAAIRAGARGYLTKTVTADDLCTALHQLVEGASVVTPHLAVRLLAEFAALSRGPADVPKEVATLTVRERQVLALVTRGKQNKEIAATLAIAENTVKVHLRNILDKLHLRNRRQAAAFAAQQGLAEPSTDIDADQ